MNYRTKKSSSIANGTQYTTLGQHGQGQTKILSKWNMKFANSFGSKELTTETMNRGASFLVAPHNLSFNKRSIQASDGNHQNVIAGLESILYKHQIEEEKKMKGLSEELVKTLKN